MVGTLTEWQGLSSKRKIFNYNKFQPIVSTKGALRTMRTVLGGKLTLGANFPRGRIVLGGKLSSGRIVLGGELSGGELSWGRIVLGANCPGGELSSGANCPTTVCMRSYLPENTVILAVFHSRACLFAPYRSFTAILFTERGCE